MELNKNHLASKTIRDRGWNLYMEDSVKIVNLEINMLDQLVVEANVDGSRGSVYDTRIILHGDNVVDYDCDCPYNYAGACKHVLALCYEFEEVGAEALERLGRDDEDFPWDEELDDDDIRFTYDSASAMEPVDRGEEFISLLKSFDDDIEEEVCRVEVEVKENRGYYRDSIALEFYILNGAGRVLVPNILRFTNAFRYRNVYRHRNKVIYDYNKDKLDKKTERFMQYLCSFIDMNRINSGTIEGDWRGLFDALEVFIGYDINIFTKNGSYSKDKRFKFDLEIKDVGDKVKIVNKDSHNIRIKNKLLYTNETLYHIPLEEKDLVIGLIEFFNKGREIEFPKEKIGNYIDVFEKYSKNMRYAKGDTGLLGLEGVKMDFYLDKDPYNNILASIKTTYKDEEVDIFDPELEIFGKEEALEEIEKYITGFGFQGEKGYYLLEDETLIYEFLNNQLTFLKKRGGVYFSDDFDILVAKQRLSIKSHLSYGDKKSIDIRFDLDGVEDLELDEVLSAYKKKEKYIRLKNGSFLELQDKTLDKFAQAMEDLDADNIINLNLPSSSLLYLNNKLSNLKLGRVEKSKEVNEYLKSFRKKEKFELREDYEGILRHYQKDGVDWLSKLSKFGLGGILADDMGLGKTLQVLAFINSQKDIGQTLVVVPKSLLYNWVREIEKFADDMSYIVIDGGKVARKKLIEGIGDERIVLTSYSLLRQDIEHFEEMEFEYIFIDEAQHIKNPTAQLTKAVKQVKADKRFAMTGTPIENRIDELWSIFDYIMPTYLNSLGRFNNIYGRLEPHKLEDLKHRVSSFILRRTKEKVLTELPEKLESEVYVELNKKEKALYKAYVEGFMEGFGEETDKLEILTVLLKLRQICCHSSLVDDGFKGKSSKEEAVVELIQDAIDGGHRILLFSQFTSMLKILESSLHKAKVSTFYLDGQTPGKKRLDLVDQFNEGEGEVFLISLKAGGTGLNLIGADTVIHYDPWWNPAVEDQASDRVYRIGQKKKVQVIKVLTKGTIEEKIFDIQQSKKELTDSILSVDSKKTLLEKDLMKLLELD